MSEPDKKDELEGTEAPFVSHLVELRDRLIRAVIAIAVAFAALAFWPGPSGLYDLLAAPLVAHLPKGATLIATNVISPILVPLKITLMAAFMVALPVVLYQVWAFVAPGLYSHEKRLVMPLVVSSTLLFVAGVAFCYFLVIPGMSKFIQAFAPTSITAAPDIEQYFGFVLTLFLVFGISFEVPIAVIVLARMGVVTLDQLRKWRGYFIVGSFIVAAVVTPPDVISQLALAIPMCILYEIGIIAASFSSSTPRHQRQKPKASPAPDPFCPLSLWDRCPQALTGTGAGSAVRRLRTGCRLLRLQRRRPKAHEQRRLCGRPSLARLAFNPSAMLSQDNFGLIRRKAMQCRAAAGLPTICPRAVHSFVVANTVSPIRRSRPP